MYVMGQEEIDAVCAVLRSGQLFRYRGGEEGPTTRAEKKMAERFGCDYALATTSGTGALICGLVGMGIGPGDEVIVPAYTWLASAGAVLSVGAIPVLVDIDETLTLDPAAFERHIGPRVKAVIPVHMGGRPSDMDAITSIASRHGIKVLEDVCQAIGGSFKGRPLGSIGEAGAFSFNQFKIISCGEGGALLTSNRQLFERGLYYHDMGCTFRGHAGALTEEPFLGNTFRMNDILGAILDVQLDRLDDILDRLRERRNRLLAAVAAEGGPLTASPSADTEGDCGIGATFIFASAEKRLRFAERSREINPAIGMGSPIDSGLHVYTNWKTLLNRQGGFHPAINPFLREENRACRLDITPDCCVRTLDILARTGVVNIGIDWSLERCDDIAAALCRAALETLL